MQRVAASLLIVLTALMAFLPQAMCPCSTRVTAAGEAPAAAGRTSERACCPLCKRSGGMAQRPARTLGTTSRAPVTPQSPGDPCPCCRMNGQGKWLVTPGAQVKPPAPRLLDIAIAAPAMPRFELLLDVVAGRAIVPDALASPPLDLRAGVVLLI